MTMAETKALKKGDKFWIDQGGGMAAHFQEEILGIEIKKFGIIQVEFNHFPEDCWYIPEVPQYKGGLIAWFKCSVDGKEVDIHTGSMDGADVSKSRCQAITVKNNIWKVKTPDDIKLLDVCSDEFPELFL